VVAEFGVVGFDTEGLTFVGPSPMATGIIDQRGIDRERRRMAGGDRSSMACKWS
jgi:hypothetical protein